MSKHKRRKRRIESNMVLAPLSVYRDEAACRAAIRYLEKQLWQAYKVLARLIKKKHC